MTHRVVRSIFSLLLLCLEVLGVEITALQTTSTSVNLPQLTTGFTPPAECNSLTIIHYQRYAAVYQGCVGSDSSCCPQYGRMDNVYSPGRCPLGYMTEDPHVGLDELGTNWFEWEATCIPAGFTTCTIPRYMLPQIPIGGNTICPRQYTSQLPQLTSPLTVVVIYYSTYAYSLDSTLPWPYREGFRTTAVLSETWPTLTPDSTAPRQILVSHFVIRWKDSDFSSTNSAPNLPSNTLFTPSPGSANTKPITATVSTGNSAPAESSTNTFTASSTCASCQPNASPTPTLQFSQSKIAGITIGAVLGTASLVFGALFYGFRRRKIASNRETGHELHDPGPNVGCLTLYKGDTGLVADIVLVHGLRGHRTRTWTKDGCCWPKDLLPRSLPGVRVITFGYDSSVARLGGSSSTNSIGHHATSLLSDLSHMRTEDSERPIIFVTHSLGGILVKDALNKARQPSPAHRYLPIFTSTHSILFLGTPHHGSAYARIGRSFTSTIRSLFPFLFHSSNPSLLHTLEYDSEILERIGEDFRNTVAYSESQGTKIKVASFAEELGLGLGSLASPIVQTRSAFIGLPEEITETIWAHHRDICRFDDELNIGYQRVSRRIIEFVADASASPRLSGGSETSEASRVSVNSEGSRRERESEFNAGLDMEEEEIP